MACEDNFHGPYECGYNKALLNDVHDVFSSSVNICAKLLSLGSHICSDYMNLKH